MKSKKILFISHAEKDIDHIQYFVNLLYHIGLRKENMFCSSISGLDVPLKENIYDYLRNLMNSDSVIPLFMLSENYYRSAACLNEMGAVWVMQKEYYTFLLPNFEFKQIKGAINPSNRGIKLYGEDRRLKGDLSIFKNELCKIFNLPLLEDNYWDSERDAFIENMRRSSPVFEIDIQKCEGFCIGQVNYGACLVDKNVASNKVTATIDFSKTTSELCSFVFFIGGIDFRSHFAPSKSLHFKLKATGDIKRIFVETHLHARNPHVEIHASNDWEEYTLPLNDFANSEFEWQNFKEICFVVSRRLATKGTIEIKDIDIIDRF